MQPDHNHNIIEVRDICFSYGATQVLHNIDLDIHKGDYLGVIGPNGGGKTTLIKIILGLITPQCGSIKLFGKDLRNFKDWSKIGYVAQNPSHSDANFPATVNEVVSMGRFAKRGLFRSLTKEDEKAIKEALSQVGMLEFKDRLISDLSGGQHQRVCIARALAGNPEVLFLDEPTVGVDFQNQEEFYKLLKKLNKDIGLTLVLVSHDLGVIASEVTEIACVNNNMVYHGSPKELSNKDLLEHFYGKGVKIISHQDHV